MGNLCSKSSNEPDHFSQPGRVLGANSQTAGGASSSTVPKKVISSTPGRTLGSGSREGATSPNNARSAAAKAAEERAAKAAKGGKLSSQLEAQKKQTRNELLNSASDAERRARDADEGAQARNWN